MNQKEKGASLYFALVILAILMSIVFGVSAIIIIQLKTIKEMGDSVIAFYAADTGVERTLLETRPPAEGGSGATVGSIFSEILENDSEYRTEILATTSPGCSGDYYCIKSIGTYLPSNTKRGIQIDR